MNLLRFLKSLLAKDAGVTADQALAIARDVCASKQWPWSEPVHVQHGWGTWVIHTSWGYKGSSVRVVIDRATGKLLDARHMPR